MSMHRISGLSGLWFSWLHQVALGLEIAKGVDVINRIRGGVSPSSSSTKRTEYLYETGCSRNLSVEVLLSLLLLDFKGKT